MAGRHGPTGQDDGARTDHASGPPGVPEPRDPAELPTRRERRLAARSRGRVDARGPRTGEVEVTDAALAARDAAGLTADLSASARWRWLQREDDRARHATPPPRTEPPTGGRHRGNRA